jgi:hypothetical protein
VDVLSKPKIEVVITRDGVDVVRLYGAGWCDSDAAVALYMRVAPLLRQIHVSLRTGDLAKPN